MLKGFFYLSMSIVIIAIYFPAKDYLEIGLEKHRIMDAYYKKEFVGICSNYYNPQTIDSFEYACDNLKKVKKNAIDDGYSMAEVETMWSKITFEEINKVIKKSS